MDEERQPESNPGHPDASAWRSNGAHGVHRERGADHGWSSAGAALEPSAEPLALLTGDRPGRAGRVPAPAPPVEAFAQTGPHEVRQPPRYAPGLDDATPPSGMPAVEPPLWREATRRSPLPPPQEGAPTGLPQRVPAEPDVPVVTAPDPEVPAATEPAAARDRWTAPELAWIADQLRRDDVPAEAPPETVDVDAVVTAVREVSGVRAASVRTNPNGVLTLRLDLADEADPGEVSRAVARLLLERMGLSTAPQEVPETKAPVPEPPPDPAPAWPPPANAATPAPVPREPAPPTGNQPPAGTLPADHLPADHLPADHLPADQLPAVEPPVNQLLGTQPPAVEPPVDPLAADQLAVDEPAVAPVLAEPGRDGRPLPPTAPAPRVVIEEVQVNTSGLDGTVEVRLTAGDRRAIGTAGGPAVDSYLVRLAAVAAAKAIDELLRRAEEPDGPYRCFVEHTGVVSFAGTEVAVAVVLLVCGGWVERLTGSALVDGDPRQAVVRATLGAVNRRLEALLDADP